MYKYPKKYSPRIQSLLKGLVENFEKEDQTARERQLRVWRQLHMMWENFRSGYYDEVAHDWRLPEAGSLDINNDQAYYDKPINIFRAYLESIFAALSITIPPIKCYPDDAENAADLDTAKAGDQIAKLIYRHNDVSLLWLHALWLYGLEGLVAAYNESDAQQSYGTYDQDQYKVNTETHLTTLCPNCRYEFEDIELEGPADPTEVVELGEETCPQCGAQVIPATETWQAEVAKFWRTETKEKVRQSIKAFGGLNIRVPNWARNQEECIYLNYDYESHYAFALEKYPHLYGEIDCGIYNAYEVWARLSPQYYGEYPRDNVTCRYWWLRPASFNTLNEDESKELKKLFPNGVRIDLVNDTYAGAEAENLDDCWTLTINPFSDYVHSDPIGLLLVSVQDITNDLVSLVLQTVEHGVGQTFADPSVLNFNAYRQMEVVPGGVYPATPKAGKALGEGFFEVKTATLSQEVMPFGQEIQAMGQMVSGALPSLFGGAMEEQKTASGYAMSRAQALQRLQNTWKLFTIWWKTIFSKAIPKYIAQVEWDEREVSMDTQGNFINTFIRMSQLQGKIGRFELEANENLPITWAQKKDVVMKLFELNNPEILAYLGAPENLTLIREAIGLDEFVIPGENDRNKQYEEIRMLLQSGPLPMGMDMMGGIMEGPSVEIDAEYDNHQIHFEILRNWVVGPEGRLAKIENPEGYRNALLHGRDHMMQIQMAMMPPPGMEQGAPGEKPKENSNAPINSEADVNAQV